MLKIKNHLCISIFFLFDPQVAEWMGRREAWSSKEGSADSRTKPTRWEFSKRGYSHQKLGLDNPAADNDEDDTMRKSFNIRVDEDKEVVNIL